MSLSSIAIALLATSATPDTCTDGLALARGVAAITYEYPWQSANKKDYLVRNYPRMYLIVLKKLDKKLKEGGSPTATVNKQNCQVINVYLAR
ncbi:hypothetical protein P3339_21105 [Microbulbifer sp. MLAF003]|uniref:hypothetical protein n=1 Tax=Microbulbifer sp. MLAF003 TaxID=3032582 RepID=UPI0024AE1349|nr:hypothetical protein [Microbulbifer sp. MLAF003]WHI50875.1 hypothetical protein P3339_21105 [Microbulbifer sp. MLAF003]